MRLGCPSWVRPGTWGENLDFILSGSESPVDGVELLFFDFDDKTKAILAAEMPAIARAAGRLELSVHLPSRLGPETLDLVDMLKNFARVFVVHPPKRGDEAIFTGFLRSAVAATAAAENVPPAPASDDAPVRPVFALEYTRAEEFRRGLDIIDAQGIPVSICMDTGHLLLEGRDPADFAAEAGTRLAHIHLHDISGDATGGGEGRFRDHARLSADSPWLARLAPTLKSFAGIVELELFDWDSVLDSSNVLKSMIAET